MTYETKDSGERAEYDSGMVRDTDKGKPRFDLLIAKDQPYDNQFMVLWREGGAETYYAPYYPETSAEQMALAANAAENSMILWLSSGGNTKSALSVATMLEAYEYYAWKEAGYGDEEDQWPYKDQLVTRFAELMARGAEKYGDRNWERGQGQAELDRARSSAYRHLKQWVAHETDEDHAAAVLFNLMAAEYFQWKMRVGYHGKAEDKPKPRGEDIAQSLTNALALPGNMNAKLRSAALECLDAGGSIGDTILDLRPVALHAGMYDIDILGTIRTAYRGVTR